MRHFDGTLKGPPTVLTWVVSDTAERFYYIEAERTNGEPYGTIPYGMYRWMQSHRRYRNELGAQVLRTICETSLR